MKKLFRQIKVLLLGFLSLLIGMRVTIKNFFAPSVTLDYPRQKQPMTANFRGMVDLKPEACVICYQCIKICPTAALYLSHKNIAVEEKKKMEITKFTYNAVLCCFCGLCDEICPTDAIFMNKKYEVSAYEHEQILNIDLMEVGKYKHLDANYSLAEETKRNEENTVGKVVKPAPAPAASAVASGAAGSAATAAPTSVAADVPNPPNPTPPTTENKQAS